LLLAGNRVLSGGIYYNDKELGRIQNKREAEDVLRSLGVVFRVEPEEEQASVLPSPPLSPDDWIANVMAENSKS